MAPSSPKKGSQFSGAAAMFRKKEMELAAANNTNELISPMNTNEKFGKSNSSGAKTKKNVSSLGPPSFVSPGLGKASNDFRNSWKDSAALSPPPFAKNYAGKNALSSNTNKWKRGTPPSPHKGHKFNNYNAEPDIKILVKSDIQKSINARKQKRPFGSQHNSKQPHSFSSSQDHSDVPEHIRKARAREQRRLRALEEIEYRSASLLQAFFLGWYVRTVKYPVLRAANIGKLKRRLAILIIQKTFRMYVRRKRYRYVIGIKRRRERNVKEIKKIQKKIDKMPKKTKQDIKELKQVLKEKKKEYESRKKELKKSSKQIKEDGKQIGRAKESGKEMIKYLTEENDKVKNLAKTIQKEQRLLEKQFEVLTAKSEEIACNFKSLQKWVDAKNESLKKNGTSDQKCRYRYLPKYRDDLALRNRHCIAEFRIKELYKRQMEKIVKEIGRQSTDLSLVKFVQKEKKSCQKLMKEMPHNPIPECLEHRMKH